MARVVVAVRNVEQVARKIEALYREAGESLVSGTRVIGEMIMTDVKATRPGAGVPRDMGPLAASGRVDGPDRESVVRLTFGGAAAPYALRQHEELSYYHDDGEARYLVRGLERWQAGGNPEKALKENMEAGIRAAKRQA